MKQYVLLNPGPACTTDAVKRSLLYVGDVCPREIETGDLMRSVSDKIKSELTSKPENYEAILLTSSGTGAVEMVISSLPKGSKVLNIINGSYGKRIDDMLKIYKIEHVSLDFYEGVIELDRIKTTISDYRNFTHISMIHCETTTGVINDLKEISKIAKTAECELIVDAMSSAFAYPIDMYEDSIHFLCCSSNKLVQGIAGLGIVVSNKESLKKCNARTVYLDLKSQYDYFEKTKQMRFTPPVQIINSLNTALLELKKEGVQNRYNRYEKLNLKIRIGMESMGFVPLIGKENNSIVITSFLEPENFNFDEFHDFLKQKGFVIYPGKVSNKNTFRISNIGDINEEDIDIFLSRVLEYTFIFKKD